MNGAAWYKHDTDMSADEKIIYLESVFGLTGYALFNKFLEALARSDDHRLRWNDITRLVFARKFFVEAETLDRFIAEATRSEIAAFVLEDGFLHSPGLTKRLEPMREKREEFRENAQEKKRRKKEYDRERYAQRRAESLTATIATLHDEHQLELYEQMTSSEQPSECRNEHSEISPVHSHKKREEKNTEKKEPHPPALRTEDEMHVDIHPLRVEFTPDEATNGSTNEAVNEAVNEKPDEFLTTYVFDADARENLPKELAALQGFPEQWADWVRYRKPSIFAARSSLDVLAEHTLNGYDPRKIIAFTMQAGFRVLAQPNETHRLAATFAAASPTAKARVSTSAQMFGTHQNPRRFVCVEFPGGVNPHVPVETLDFTRAEHLWDKPLLTNEEYHLVKKNNAPNST